MFTSTQISKTPIGNRLILAAAAIGLLGMSSIVKADALVYGARSKQVVLKDLDLSTAQGQRIALDRVLQMARSLCTQVEDGLDLSRQPNYVACVDSAMANATRSLQALVSRKGATMLAQNPVK
jgi:UrcA family protein